MAEVRDIDYMAWKNTLAWMEPQTGRKWEETIKKENTAFKEAVQPLAKQVAAFTRLLNKPVGRNYPFTWRGWESSGNGFSPTQTWTYTGTDFSCDAWDVDIDKRGFFAASVPDAHGFERFNVEVYSTERGYVPVRIARLRKCGPDLAWLQGGILVYLGSSHDLRYDTLRTWDPETKEHSILYTLDDPTKNLKIGRAEDGSVYVLQLDFVETRVGFVFANRIEWKKEGRGSVFVQGYDTIITDSTRVPGLPPDDPIEAISEKGGWAITRHYGMRTVWQMDDSIPKSMITVWGEVSFDIRDPRRLQVTDMRYEPYTVKTENWTLSSPKPYDFPCSYYNDIAPVFVIHPRETVEGLLVTAYGAYGSPTRVGNLVKRWRPLLENGWAVASVCVPGSGDHDDAWKRSGQRQRRDHSIDLFTKTIQALQGELGVPPESTALYGRSAGGLLVISTALKTRGLVGGLYVESPYVDVLRTISNPDLPLTLLETSEFGVGTNPTNMITTGKWSPMERIPGKGVPDMFIVARSDRADLEVFPYEVVKWIKRMRGANKGKPKYLYVHRDHGHFTTTTESRAEDLALLLNALRSKNLEDKYRMAATRRNRRNNVSRRNRRNRRNVSRRNRNNAPAANSTMMGGRRRRNRNRTMMGGWANMPAMPSMPKLPGM